MSHDILKDLSDRFQTTFFGPTRELSAATLDHVEKLATIQYEATRAYADLGIEQARAAMQIRDAAGFQSYVADQQKLVETIGRRIKGDAEQVTSLNQAYVHNAQQVGQASAEAARVG